jgi:hypothetical protein
MSAYRQTLIILLAWPLIVQAGCGRQQNGATLSASTAAKDELKTQPVFQVNDDAKDIIAKSIKAYGGETAFSRWKCGYVKYIPKGTIMPKLLGAVVLEDTFQLPGQFKRVNRMKADGQEHAQIWVQGGGKPGLFDAW